MAEGREGFNGGRIQNGGGSSSDPLFLSNSDYPVMQLVSIPFNGLNFTSWSRSVTMALGAKLKLGFVNGMCTKPVDDDEALQRWIRADYMVR